MFENLKFPVVTHKRKAQIEKKNRKRFLKIKKAAKRRNHFILSGTFTRCKECGHTEYLSRLGCARCKSRNGLVEHGAYVYYGEIKTENKRRVYENEEFCTYKQIHHRLIAGDRFFDWVTAKEITIKNF